MTTDHESCTGSGVDTMAASGGNIAITPAHTCMQLGSHCLLLQGMLPCDFDACPVACGDMLILVMSIPQSALKGEAIATELPLAMNARASIITVNWRMTDERNIETK